MLTLRIFSKRPLRSAPASHGFTSSTTWDLQQQTG